MGRNDNKLKYTGKPLFPYVPPMVPQAAAPAPAPAPVQPAAPPQAPLFNILPVYNAPVRTVAQPLRNGQPTRRALMQHLQNPTE